MSDSFRFHLRNLRCQSQNPHPLDDGDSPHVPHIHGGLGIQLGPKMVEYLPEDVCINDWLSELIQTTSHALRASGQEPETFFLVGSPKWPDLEFIRMKHLVRVSFWSKGQLLAFRVLKATELQAEVDRLNAEFEAVAAGGGQGESPIAARALNASRCHDFTGGAQGAALPAFWEKLLDTEEGE